MKRGVQIKRYAAPSRRRAGKPRRGPPDIPADRWRNPGYLQFLRNEGKCLICQGRGCDPAHGPVNGQSSKGPDSGAGPLCRAHHDEQHRIGWHSFECRYGFSREIESAVWWSAYQIWREM